MGISKEEMKPLVQMLEASLVENEQALTDKMTQLSEIHQETVKLRDAFYRYAKFITPDGGKDHE